MRDERASGVCETDAARAALEQPCAGLALEGRDLLGDRGLRAAVLARLAALDETAAISLPALIAEQDGRPVAARSLADGMVAADPFARTTDVVELLELRAARLTGPAGGRRVLGRRRGRRPAFARA